MVLEAASRQPLTPGEAMSSISTSATHAAASDTSAGLRGVLHLLVDEKQLGVTFITTSIERADGAQSKAFVPAPRNAVTVQFHRAVALKWVGGHPAPPKYGLPDDTLAAGRVGLFSTLEIVETVEVSLHLIGVSAVARASDSSGSSPCVEAMETDAVHRAPLLFVQERLGKNVSVPRDVCFEDFDRPAVSLVRDALKANRIGYGAMGRGTGRFYDSPGDPPAYSVGTPVSHIIPQLQ
jgi:hypothetical protein